MTGEFPPGASVEVAAPLLPDEADRQFRSLSGIAAARSAPGKAAVVFMRAARTGEKSVLRVSMTREAGGQLDGPYGKDILEMLRMVTPDPSWAQIESVDLNGSTAEVTVVELSADATMTSTLHLVLEHGHWKVSGCDG